MSFAFAWDRRGPLIINFEGSQVRQPRQAHQEQADAERQLAGEPRPPPPPPRAALSHYNEEVRALQDLILAGEDAKRGDGVVVGGRG